MTYFKAGLDSTTLLNMLTGSRGSMIRENIGRIEKGYAADLTILNTKSTKTLPLNNPVDLVVNYLEGDDVTDVLINGKLVVENSRVTTVNEEKVMEELLNREEEIKEKINELLKHLKLVRT